MFPVCCEETARAADFSLRLRRQVAVFRSECSCTALASVVVVKPGASFLFAIEVVGLLTSIWKHIFKDPSNVTDTTL